MDYLDQQPDYVDFIIIWLALVIVALLILCGIVAYYNWRESKRIAKDSKWPKEFHFSRIEDFKKN